MTRIDLAWRKAALDVAGRVLTIMLVVLLLLAALPAAAALGLHYEPRTTQQQTWDAIAFVTILAYAAAGAGLLVYSLIGRHRVAAISGFAVTTILVVGFVTLKMSRFG
ncbi:hypothetical protein [Sphingosinicella terrae]|uniref:hypothetical protein n=1 Tax=Sphingosinicella terrae TaxID=2172047 RepID=UPI000E0D3D9C|nr:hypothetical protein [Sphingosinicella terrae]